MRRGRLVLFIALIGTLWPSGAIVGGGFDRAVETASARVVKLYGLGAGRQEGQGRHGRQGRQRRLRTEESWPGSVTMCLITSAIG